ATRSNIFKLGRGTISQIQFDETIHDPFTLYFDRAGALWIGTVAHGLYSFSGGNLAHYKTGPKLETTVNAIYQDREGSLWAGLLKGGACRLRAQRFECFTEQDGLTDNFVASFFEDREGSFWIGTITGGLNRLKDRKFVTYDRSRGLPNDFVMSVYQAPDRAIW